MEKRRDTDHSISEEAKAVSEKKKRRKSELTSSVEDDFPEDTKSTQSSHDENKDIPSDTHKRHKKKKRSKSKPSENSEMDKKGEERSDVTDNTNELEEIRKREQKQKRKEKKLKKLRDEENITSSDQTPAQIESESQTPVKKKKHKKKTHSKNDLPEDNKHDVGTSVIDHSNTNELEEIIKQERKQKKKAKKLKKLKEVANSTTSDIEQVAPSGCELALDYLTQWVKDRENWRFQKVRQVWLLQNMYDQQKVEDSKFQTLLQYLDGLKGKSRETTLAEAEKIIALDEDSGEEMKVSETKLERARQLIQTLT